MAFQISNQEIVQHHFHTGLSRVLMEQVQRLESLLTSYRASEHQNIIESSRDCVFRIHALLQLLQSFTGETFCKEERAFRQLKAALSQHSKDTEVIHALTKLIYLSPGANSLLVLKDVKQHYINEKEGLPNISLQRRRFVDKALLLVLNVKKSSQMSVPEIYDIDMFADIIARSHQESVRTYNHCAQFAGDDDFQQLYNAVTLLRYQTEVLQNFAFAPTHVKRKYLERLETKLHLYNNLTTLVYRLEQSQSDYLGAAKLTALSEIVDKQKSVLAAELFQLGKKMLTMNFASINNKHSNVA